MDAITPTVRGRAFPRLLKEPVSLELKAKVYLVGAGPGDPDLLTRKAVRVLEQADVVIYHRLVSAEVLAVANPDAVFIYAGKRRGQQEEIQNEIFAYMLKYATCVRSIVRLKSGDPLIFGRDGEELEFLAQHSIDAEVVPGLSSALAAPALAGIPLTYRGVATSLYHRRAPSERGRARLVPLQQHRPF